MRFAKGHGTGNDFVVIPDPDGDLELSDAAVAAMCNRHTGIGADGVLRVVLTAAVDDYASLSDDARWFMDYRNADGSAVETCGNGIRVFARYLLAAGYTDGDVVRIATRDGIKHVIVNNAGFTVDMGTPKADPADPVTVGVNGADYSVTCVSVGNPHAVIVVDDPSRAPLERVGESLQQHELFPGGVNVELVTVRAPDAVAMRVWERGVGETQSCGSGACAAVVATSLRGATGRAATVAVPGGELHVEWRADDRILLTGPAEIVAEGAFDDGWLAAHA
ncbi:MAG: diaminopimelate epimerase [Mycobacteriales bacterium]|nr:diaminopimelate epimerase [Frankia sp.]